MHYNLLDEKWIRVLTSENKYAKCSVRDIIKNAHLYKDFDTEPYNGVKFYPYDYLLIRFFTTLVTRVYHEQNVIKSNKELTPDFKKKKIEEGKFDESVFQRYFEQFSERFDLFNSEHPFMQISTSDLKKLESNKDYKKIIKGSTDNFFTANPATPGASGRTIYANIDSESFVNAKRPENNVYVFSEKENAQSIAQAVSKSMPVSCENFAYIVLYNNSLVPGSGCGYISALTGNSYIWEVIQGKNLYETITYNLIKEDKYHDYDFVLPIWEWETSFPNLEGALNRSSTVSKMFYPARIIRGYAENGYVTRLIYENLKKDASTRSASKYIEGTRKVWSLDGKYGDPHALCRRLKGDKAREATKNGYQKCEIGDDTWLLLISDSQKDYMTKSVFDSWDKIKEVNTDEISYYPNSVSEFANATEDKIKLTLYYRVVTDKWTYQKTGKLTGILPPGLFKDGDVNRYVNEMAMFIKFAASSVALSVKKVDSHGIKKDRKTEKIDGVYTAFIDQIADQFGINKASGYLKDIVENPTKEVYEKNAEEVIRKAEEMYKRAVAKNRNRILFYKELNALHWKLWRKLYEKNG